MRLLYKCLLIFSLCLTAQAEIKLGYVDVDEALLKTKVGQEVDSTLKKAVEKKQKALEKREAEIEKMTSELKKKKPVLSTEAFTRRRQEIQEEMLKFQEFANKSQMELQQERNKLLQPLAEQMEQVIQEIAKKEGYTAIFRKSPQVLLWGSESIDLTKKVVKSFEAKSKKKKQ